VTWTSFREIHPTVFSMAQFATVHIAYLKCSVFILQEDHARSVGGGSVPSLAEHCAQRSEAGKHPSG